LEEPVQSCKSKRVAVGKGVGSREKEGSQAFYPVCMEGRKRAKKTPYLLGKKEEKEEKVRFLLGRGRNIPVGGTPRRGGWKSLFSGRKKK